MGYSALNGSALFNFDPTGGGGGTTIYSGNSAVASDRDLDMNAFYVAFQEGGDDVLKALPSGVVDVTFTGGAAVILNDQSDNLWMGGGYPSGLTSGQNNTAVGNTALLALTSGNGNTAVGKQAGDSLTTHPENTFFGFNAGGGTSSYATAVGTYAMQDGDSSYGVAVGGFAGQYMDGLSCVAVGQSALRGSGSFHVTGNYNIGIGFGAGSGLRGQTDQVYIGRDAGSQASFAGNNNIGLGYESLRNVGGQGNNAIGYQSGQYFNSDYNVAYGHQAGQNLVGTQRTVDHGVFIGYQAGQLSPTSIDPIYIGRLAGSGNDGDRNIAIGTSAGATGDGDDNVFLGYQSGQNATGSGNVFLGYQSGQNETASNVLYVENSNSSTPLVYGEFDNNIFQINGNLQVANVTEGGTGFLGIQTARESHTLAAANTSDTTIDIPTGAMLIGVSINVDTAVTTSSATNTWESAYTGGSTTALAGAGTSGAQNTKDDTLIVPEIASATTNVRFTAPGAETFTAGVVEVVAYYIDLNSLANA